MRALAVNVCVHYEIALHVGATRRINLEPASYSALAGHGGLLLRFYYLIVVRSDHPV